MHTTGTGLFKTLGLHCSPPHVQHGDGMIEMLEDLLWMCLLVGIMAVIATWYESQDDE